MCTKPKKKRKIWQKNFSFFFNKDNLLIALQVCVLFLVSSYLHSVNIGQIEEATAKLVNIYKDDLDPSLGFELI